MYLDKTILGPRYMTTGCFLPGVVLPQKMLKNKHLFTPTWVVSMWFALSLTPGQPFYQSKTENMG